MQLTLLEIIEKLPVDVVRGTKSRTITEIVPLRESLRATDISWVSDSNSGLLSRIKQGTIICSLEIQENLFADSCTYLQVQNPRLYFLKLMETFFGEEGEETGISERALVHPSVKVGRGTTIRAGAVIEKDCEIGDGSVIDYNTIVKRKTWIGKNVTIGANCTIGGVGFGYEKDENSRYRLIPHIGNVVIEDFVEIGNNTTIDRAVLGCTLLKAYAKIDNLVHIAHGVIIGENSVVIANAMIAGSVKVGDNAWVAPSASVLNKCQVGEDAVIGMGAVVLRDVDKGSTVVGNPAKKIR